MSTLLVNTPLMGMPGLWEWLIIALVIALLFGAAKLPKLGKGLGEGILNFKKAIKGEENDPGKDLSTSAEKPPQEGSEETPSA